MRTDQATGIGLGRIDRLTMERLSAADVPAISDHLKRLGDFDRYSRFFSAMSDGGIDRYVDGLDWSRMIAVGLYQGDTLIGLAELGWDAAADCRDGTRPDTAEMAVTVDTAYRQRGIAAWLVAEAGRQGRKAGVCRMEASWIGGNDAIARIMRRMDAQVWLSGSNWHGTASLA